jgi:hypothetical protein
MKEQKNRQQLIREAVEKLLAMFESGKMPEEIAFTIIRRKAGDEQPSLYWSMGNQILMYAQGTLDARGYSQWKRVGRHVKKGSSAIWILAPLTRRVEHENGKVDIVVIGFKPVPVYAVEATEGKELCHPDYAPPELPPMWDVAEKLGVSVQYAPLVENYYGKYSPHSQRITLCASDAVVFFHELAHVVHGTMKPLGNGQSAEQEILAELVACILCELQGIQGYQYQGYNYIRQYTAQMKDESVIKVVMKLLNETEAVVEKILALAEEPVDIKAACTA